MDFTASFDFDIIDGCVQKLERESKTPMRDYYWKTNNEGKKSLPDSAGVYVFWWKGDLELLTEKLISCHYELKGPHNRENQIKVKFDKKWIDKATVNDGICLYVGKSTNIRQRVVGHIKPKTSDIWKNNEHYSFHKKPNTTSQLRIGLERIFKKDCLDLIKEHVFISWIPLEGDKHAINRFYIENKMISHHLALFNIDVER